MKPFVLFAVTVSSAALLNARAADKIDFAKTIKPILESRCLDCHNEEKEKGGLRFDTKELALKGGDSGNAIVPSKPDDSLMLQRVSLPADHDDIMPPKGDPLTKEQIEAIKAWIAEGAPWPDGVVLKPGGDKAPATAAAAKKKTAVDEFASLVATKDEAAENAAIEKLGAMGISVRPIAQNMPWKEGTIRPQDTNQVKAAVAELKNIPSLVDLNLAGLNIGDDDVKNIANNSNLLRLHLENTKITDAGVAHLKGLKNLRYLNLYDTEVSDSSVDTLKELKNLTHLYVWQTKVTEEGAAKLKEANPELYVNRGEELKIVAAKAEEKKSEEKKADEKKDEKKPEEKKADEKKPEEKKEEKKEA